MYWSWGVWWKLSNNCLNQAEEFEVHVVMMIMIKTKAIMIYHLPALV